jgi:hypothetical protein
VTQNIDMCAVRGRIRPTVSCGENPRKASCGFASFIANFGGWSEAPLTAKNLDAAEIVFMTCALTSERAAVLRAELERNQVASVETRNRRPGSGKVSLRKTVV